MQAYGSLALEDNSEIGEGMLGREKYFLRMHQYFPTPSARSRPTDRNAILGEDLVILPSKEL